jgi:DMSO/TMAO reductase YedYZ molybdopterin-dependent catalytic subunit
LQKNWTLKVSSLKKKVFLTLLITFGFITSVFNVTAQAASEWTLNIDGSVSNPKIITLEEIMEMPRTVVSADLYCDSAFISGGNWVGVRLSFLLETVAFDQKAMVVDFRAADGYATEISIADAMRADAIIAYDLDDVPLSETLRLVLPEKNGNFWIAGITNMSVRVSGSSPFLSHTANNPPVPQLSPTPKPSPTPQPTLAATPQPTPSPTSVSSPIPQAVHFESEQVPTALTVAAVATLTIAGAVLAVYLRKRNR